VTTRQPLLQAGGLQGIDAHAPSAAESVAAGLLDELPDGNSALVPGIEHL
jgi:hypothetical protein